MDIFLYIIFAVVVGGAIILRWWYNSPKYKGKEGENRVHNILMQLPDDYVILDDIVLQTNRGTTQIDHIVVSKYGVFAIETKCTAEGEHGEVVVLLGAVAELVGVGLEGLDDVAHT